MAEQVAQRNISATYSYAGRTARPEVLPLPTRMGGFGGVDGLAGYLTDQQMTHLIDATHPFAATISRNAIAAAKIAHVPLIAVNRPAWREGPGDTWRHTPDIASAVNALDGPAQRIFLAIGRTEVAAFAALPQHDYLLRFVDAPHDPLLLPKHHVVVDRGPFDVASDRALMEKHRIDVVVSKNSGGPGARAKLDAARALGLPVVMIDRPVIPPRHEVGTVAEVFDWLDHMGSERGV